MNFCFNFSKKVLRKEEAQQANAANYLIVLTVKHVNTIANTNV